MNLNFMTGDSPQFLVQCVDAALAEAEKMLCHPLCVRLESADGEGMGYVVPAKGAKEITFREWDGAGHGPAFPIEIAVFECDLVGQPRNGGRAVRGTITNESVQ